MKKFKVTVLRFRYIAPTMYSGSRFSVTQTNTGKRCVIPYNHEASDTAEEILDRLGVDYSQIIDNTAKNSVDYVILSVDARKGIPDYIEEIKKGLKRI